MRWALLALGCVAGASCARRVGSGEDDQRLPLIELPWVGPERYAPSMLPGRAVLVHFTATWCFTCLAELDGLAELQRAYGGRGFQVLLIGMDREGRKVLEPFAYRYRLPFPVLVADERYVNGQSRFGPISAVPANVLFGRDGLARTSWVGPAPRAQVRDAIEAALR